MDQVAPILLSAVVCERVIFDRITGMPSIINIIQTLNAPKYPVRREQFVFFCELTNGHGKTNTRVRLVDTRQQDKVLFEQQGTVEFRDVHQVVTLAINLCGLVFQQPGEYRFQLFASDNLLGERGIVCRQVTLPPQQAGPAAP